MNGDAYEIYDGDDGIDIEIEPPEGECPGLELPDDMVDDTLVLGPWPVMLLEGREVRGPFHRPAATGAPMVEVIEATVQVKRGVRQVQRSGQVARVPHDWDDMQLLEYLGPGLWYCCVKDDRGRIIAGRTVRTGRLPAQERPVDGPELLRAPGSRKADEASPGHEDRLGQTLEALLTLQREQAAQMQALMERQERELRELREQRALEEAEAQREARERDRQQLEAIIERLNQRIESGGAGSAGGGADLVTQLEALLEQRARVDTLLERIGARRGEDEEDAGAEDGIFDAAGRHVETWMRLAHAAMGADGDEE